MDFDPRDYDSRDEERLPLIAVAVATAIATNTNAMTNRPGARQEHRDHESGGPVCLTLKDYHVGVCDMDSHSP